MSAKTTIEAINQYSHKIYTDRHLRPDDRKCKKCRFCKYWLTNAVFFDAVWTLEEYVTCYKRCAKGAFGPETDVWFVCEHPIALYKYKSSETLSEEEIILGNKIFRFMRRMDVINKELECALDTLKSAQKLISDAEQRGDLAKLRDLKSAELARNSEGSDEGSDSEQADEIEALEIPLLDYFACAISSGINAFGAILRMYELWLFAEENLFNSNEESKFWAKDFPPVATLRDIVMLWGGRHIYENASQFKSKFFDIFWGRKEHLNALRRHLDMDECSDSDLLAEYDEIHARVRAEAEAPDVPSTETPAQESTEIEAPAQESTEIEAPAQESTEIEAPAQAPSVEIGEN